MTESSRQMQGSNAATPNSYHLDKVMLYPSSGGVPLNITAMVGKMEVTEDLGNPSIDVKMFLADSNNFFSEFKLNGSERVTILMKRSPLKESKQEKQKWELDLKVLEIYDYSRQALGRAYYFLRLGGPHVYNHHAKALVRPFNNTIGQLVKDIVKKDLMVDEKRIASINVKTKGIIKGVYPTIKPLKAIQWLINNAYDDGTPLYFYETVKSGIKFESQKEMFEKDDYTVYELKGFFNNQKGTAGYYDELKHRLMGLSSPLNMSQFFQLGTGVYGSTLSTIDINNKKFERSAYSFKNEKLNKNDPFSKNDKINDQTYDQIKDAKNYYVSLNSGAHDDIGNFSSPLNPTILKGESSYKSVGFNTFKTAINGDFELEVGSIVKLNIQKTGSENDVMIDKYLSGRFLVRKIESIFTDTFEQLLTLQKDSVGEDIDAT